MATNEIQPALLEKYCKLLCDKDAPLILRFRAMYIVRRYPKSEVAIKAMEKAIIEEEQSALLKHEAVYSLGQMEYIGSISLLQSLLDNRSERGIVRHEAGEALGVVGMHDTSVREFVKMFVNDEDELVRDTCLLAEQRLAWQGKLDEPSKFDSFDPTPPYESKDLNVLKTLFADQKTPLFDRYRAMFALRDIGSPEAVEILCQEMAAQHVGQALFRHELAFVLGQLHNPDAVQALIDTLSNPEQHHVVRHESAFALGLSGSYADSGLRTKARQALEKYCSDPNLIVSQSCLVGLDMLAYKSEDKIEDSPELMERLSRY